MKPPKYNIGDEIDMKEYDRSERPVNRMGFCIVTAIKRGICQSGYMVTVRSIDRKDRAEMTVDQDWLTPVSRVVA